VTNAHTMSELKFTGNCLKGSRPLLQFDDQFDTQPHLKLIKELFIQVFGTPNMHPKSKPFVDHILNFLIADGRIWFRNYQITEEFNPEKLGNQKMDRVLVEIGPRFVLNPIKLLSGSFFGTPLYENPNFISPSMVRSIQLRKQSGTYKDRLNAVKRRALRRPDRRLTPDALDHVFDEEDEEAPDEGSLPESEEYDGVSQKSNSLEKDDE